MGQDVELLNLYSIQYSAFELSVCSGNSVQLLVLTVLQFIYISSGNAFSCYVQHFLLFLCLLQSVTPSYLVEQWLEHTTPPLTGVQFHFQPVQTFACHPSWLSVLFPVLYQNKALKTEANLRDTRTCIVYIQQFLSVCDWCVTVKIFQQLGTLIFQLLANTILSLSYIVSSYFQTLNE